jgi:hypothetical protein
MPVHETEARLFNVMAGLVPAIHVFLAIAKEQCMPGTKPGMTNER